MFSRLRQTGCNIHGVHNVRPHLKHAHPHQLRLVELSVRLIISRTVPKIAITGGDIRIFLQKFWVFGLGEDGMGNFAVDVGEAEIAAGVAEG